MRRADAESHDKITNTVFCFIPPPSMQMLHRDSMGEQHVLGPNEIQTMSAGTGVVHSEFNASESEPVHLFQIWILPGAEDLQPSYQQIGFAPTEKRGRLRLLAAPEMSGNQA